jgi:hypothetical protein
MRLRCHLGWHRWEKEPSHKEMLRRSGPDILFWTFCVQVGIRQCLDCDRERKVIREGMAGMGGHAGKWKRCSDRRYAEVIKRPPI